MLQETALVRYIEKFFQENDPKEFEKRDLARYIILADYARSQAEQDPTLIALFAASSLIGSYMQANCKSIIIDNINHDDKAGFMVRSQPQGMVGFSSKDTFGLASAFIAFAENIARQSEGQ